jgi:hypothetical protein
MGMGSIYREPRPRGTLGTKDWNSVIYMDLADLTTRRRPTYSRDYGPGHARDLKSLDKFLDRFRPLSESCTIGVARGLKMWARDSRTWCKGILPLTFILANDDT